MERPIKPYGEVKAMLGHASGAWEKLLGHIRFHYVMDEKWDEGKPTHMHYNNLFIRRGGKSFCGLAIRSGYFIVTITLGKDEREKLDAQRETFSETVRNQYDAAETLHDGKWMGFEIRDDLLIDDMINLLRLKRKPNRKILPENSENCGCLDIGLSHEEITSSAFQEDI
jgi:hypothetical protein